MRSDVVFTYSLSHDAGQCYIWALIILNRSTQ